ncbi:MAG: histidine kinase [Flavobacteriaceae bacterium]|nr:histidine kinase [Flavobacteriaceae bacterium]
MVNGDTTIVILIATLIVVLFVVIIVVIFSIFQNRKIKFIFEQKEAEQRYKDEIIRSKLETQEQTLQNISWELHDNVGQLLSVARMQLNILQRSLAEKDRSLCDETGNLISKSLQEIRTLSKLLNPEVVKNIGLAEALQIEVDRLNRLNYQAGLQIEGDPLPIAKNDEIILFRIIQEFISNSVKHSKTDKLDISLKYNPDCLIIRARDYGVGFNSDIVRQGSGLINMEHRAKLIYTDFKITSEKDQGVLVTLTYPLAKNE